MTKYYEKTRTYKFVDWGGFDRRVQCTLWSCPDSYVPSKDCVPITQREFLRRRGEMVDFFGAAMGSGTVTVHAALPAPDPSI